MRAHDIRGSPCAGTILRPRRDRAFAKPGVEAVGGVDLPFQFDWQTTRARAGVDAATPPVTVLDRAATPTYLDVSGVEAPRRPLDRIPRSFRRTSRGGDQSEPGRRTLARRARGAAVHSRSARTTRRCVATVVGVVSDTRHAPYAPPDRVVYRPIAQASPSWMDLLVRTAHGPEVCECAPDGGVDRRSRSADRRPVAAPGLDRRPH